MLGILQVSRLLGWCEPMTAVKATELARWSMCIAQAVSARVKYAHDNFGKRARHLL